MKVALQEKLQEFLTCHRETVADGKKDEMEKGKKTLSTLLSNSRDKIARGHPGGAEIQGLDYNWCRQDSVASGRHLQ